MYQVNLFQFSLVLRIMGEAPITCCAFIYQRACSHCEVNIYMSRRQEVVNDALLRGILIGYSGGVSPTQARNVGLVKPLFSVLSS